MILPKLKEKLTMFTVDVRHVGMNSWRKQTSAYVQTYDPKQYKEIVVMMISWR